MENVGFFEYFSGFERTKRNVNRWELHGKEFQPIKIETKSKKEVLITVTMENAETR